MLSNLTTNQILRQLPAVHKILASEKMKEAVNDYGYDLVIDTIQHVLDIYRQKIPLFEKETLPVQKSIEQKTEELLKVLTVNRLKRVINGTGIILHTNFGRALLAKSAEESLNNAAKFYSNLEYDLELGKRGLRNNHVQELLERLTGAENSFVVNNNAAAVLLVMNTLALGKEVIVSRGELVEIGGSFRIPEVINLGGAILKEVGTTNRTHLKDYEQAITENTACILKVHSSNFQIMGFTKSVSRKDLLNLALTYQIPLVEDVGSGSLLDLKEYGFNNESPVQQVIKDGVDVVTFSGDKLLGGPQAGLIVGKERYIEGMKKNQLSRALRVDKFTLAALEATLREYLWPQKALREIPLYKMLTIQLDTLQKRAERIIAHFFVDQQNNIELVETEAQLGGGSLPGQGIISWGLRISVPGLRPEQIEKAFRQQKIPIIGYIQKEQFIIDLRTVLPEEDEQLIQGIKEISSVKEGGE